MQVANRTLGNKLKAAREEKGISIKDLAGVTRIRAHYIKDLESNLLVNLPPKTFVLGFLKSISQILELDESDLTSLYLQEISEMEETIQQPHLKRKVNYVFWAGMGFLLVGLAIYFFG